MKLTTWAATLSILTSTVVIVGSGIVRLTEPRVLRTLPPTPPPARSVEPGPHFLAPEGRTPQRAVGLTRGGRTTLKAPASGGPNRPEIGTPRDMGVTGWRDSQQAFEGGAAWKDTRGRMATTPIDGLMRKASEPNETVIAGIKPGHHLRTLASQATIERAISAAGLCGVPASIGLRLFARESGLRQFDAHGRLLVSSSGAAGIGQIKPSSAAEVSPTLDVRDEWQNMVASMCYLSSRRGTWREKVLAYRVGASGVRTAAAHAYADSILKGHDEN